MKKIKQFILFGFYLAMLFLTFQGCCSEPPESIVYVLVDQTEIEEVKYEKSKYIGSFDSIMEIFGIDLSFVGKSRKFEGKGHGFIVIMPINDCSLNHWKKFYLKKDTFNTTKMLRKVDVEAFYKDSKKSFEEILFFGKESKKYKKTELLSSMIRCLHELLNEKEDTSKHLIIFSDMLENSNEYSFYKKDINNELERIRIKLRGSFSEEEKKKIKNIKVVVVMHPKKEKDRLLKLAEQFWGNLFRNDLGAEHTVISTNL